MTKTEVFKERVLNQECIGFVDDTSIYRTTWLMTNGLREVEYSGVRTVLETRDDGTTVYHSRIVENVRHLLPHLDLF